MFVGSLKPSRLAAAPGGSGGTAVGLVHTCPPQFNSNRTSVVRCGRQKYERSYPVMLVQPDGSTINIQYREPRRILLVSQSVSQSVREPAAGPPLAACPTAAADSSASMTTVHRSLSPDLTQNQMWMFTSADDRFSSPLCKVICCLCMIKLQVNSCFSTKWIEKLSIFGPR